MIVTFRGLCDEKYSCPWYLFPQAWLNIGKVLKNIQQKMNSRTYWVWGVILLTQVITAFHQLHSRGCMNKWRISWSTWPWCWIDRYESNDKIWMILGNFDSCACVVSRRKITSRTHFSKQQEPPTTRQTLRIFKVVKEWEMKSILALAMDQLELKLTYYANLQFQTIHNSRAWDNVSINYVRPVQYTKDSTVNNNQSPSIKGHETRR